ncbi:MAG: peptide-methionine (S)-S-oxide reductase MsrA [Candidatus Saccharimonadales bacterium]
MTTYVLAGGCFWCIDAVFRRLKGVSSVVSGYAGGEASDASYYTVATGNTGHAEAVQVTFDETVIAPSIILDIFFLIHDPTTKNRQGADVGPQYRSVMFYADDAQRGEFETVIERAGALWDAPIVTDLAPLEGFYEAESEHQDYFANNPGNGYCSVVIEPKIVKARRVYAKWFEAEA